MGIRVIVDNVVTKIYHFLWNFKFYHIHNCSSMDTMLMLMNPLQWILFLNYSHIDVYLFLKS
jgi:hypothetical protein